MKRAVIFSFMMIFLFVAIDDFARPGGGNSFSSGTSGSSHSSSSYSGSSSTSGTNWTIPINEDAVFQPGGIVFLVYIFGVVFCTICSMNIGNKNNVWLNILGLIFFYLAGFIIFLLEVSIGWGVFYYILITLLSLGAYKGQQIQHQSSVVSYNKKRRR